MALYGGWDVRHHYPVSEANPWKGAAIGLARWRVDGFAAMVNACGNQPRLVNSGMPGWVLTKPVQVTGPSLLVNVNAASGVLSAEICQPESGQPIPGFTKEDCLPVRHDTVRAELLWRQGDLQRLVGRQVAIKFHIENSWLYSYSFYQS